MKRVIWHQYKHCYNIVSCKGEVWCLLKRLNPLHLFAPFQVRNLMFSRPLLMWLISFFLVSRLLYRLDRWFSRLNGFTLVIFETLYILLFDVSQGCVLKPLYTLTYGLLLQIVFWIESCLICTHIIYIVMVRFLLVLGSCCTEKSPVEDQTS